MKLKPIRRKAGELDNLSPEARKFIRELDKATNEVIRKSNAGQEIVFKTLEEAHQWIFENPDTDLIVCVEP